MDETNLRVRSAKVQGLSSFPTWNGTIAAPDTRALCSILGADGELVILEMSRTDAEHHSPDSCVRVVKVLRPERKKSSTCCHCWARDGSVVVTAHDRNVVFYNSEDFHVLARLQMRYTVKWMDLIQRQQTAGRRQKHVEFLLSVCTAFGAYLFTIVLNKDRSDVKDPSEQTLEALPPVARAYAGIAMCILKFSRDGHSVAMGTMDGRLFMRRLESHGDQDIATFGTAVLSRVLQAPRVTSLCFSACSTKLVVTAKQSSVYIFTYSSDTRQWQSLPSCFDRNDNIIPKTGNATNSTPTLATCWGPAFVVCSRTNASRLEVFDLVSGSRLHSLQLVPSTRDSSVRLSQSVEMHMITGICSIQASEGKGSHLLCYDTSATLVLVEWPFLDVFASSLPELNDRNLCQKKT